VIPAPVRYVRAQSFEDAFEALSDPDAKVLAGGQSLLPLLKLRVVRPSTLVDVFELRTGGVELEGDELRIGALTTWNELERAPELGARALAAIAECAAVIGDLQVRNRGTLGGSLVHADPASDMPAVMLALGARLVIRSAAGERTLAAEDFFAGPFMTALSPTELLVEVRIPLPAVGSGSAYAKVEHPASGFALAGAAAFVWPGGHRTIALIGVGARPLVLSADAEPEDAIAKAEIFGDDFAPEDYRRHLATVVARRALERAHERAEAAR
jgi:aerobic carbon-monoxide dehydrogenase medium subunit